MAGTIRRVAAERRVVQRTAGGGEECGRNRVRNRRIGSLNELAPLFVHEEEGLVALVVVDVRNDDRAADVSAEDVQAKFRAGLIVLLLEEVVAGVESIVAVELPQRRRGIGALPT